MKKLITILAVTLLMFSCTTDDVTPEVVEGVNHTCYVVGIPSLKESEIHNVPFKYVRNFISKREDKYWKYTITLKHSCPNTEHNGLIEEEERWLKDRGHIYFHTLEDEVARVGNEGYQHIVFTR